MAPTIVRDAAGRRYNVIRDHDEWTYLVAPLHGLDRNPRPMRKASCVDDGPFGALARLREELDATPHHPDAEHLEGVRHLLTIALAGIGTHAAQMSDKAAREAISAEPHGTLSNLSDAITDLAHAVMCWRERPENDPEYLRAATRADAAREASL